MKLDKLWNGLKRIANGDYVLEGDLICDENLEIELDDRLVVKGKIEVKKNITAVKGINAGEGIKAGWGINAGEGINAGCGINAVKGINAGEGIKAGWGINAGEGINAGTFIHCEKRIFAGLSVYNTNENCKKIIECAELQKGEICFGELVIKPNLKPCPFCGNKKVNVESYNEINGKDDDDENESYAVICSVFEGGCGATGGYKDTPEAAFENWNQRT